MREQAEDEQARTADQPVCSKEEFVESNDDDELSHLVDVCAKEGELTSCASLHSVICWRVTRIVLPSASLALQSKPNSVRNNQCSDGATSSYYIPLSRAVKVTAVGGVCLSPSQATTNGKAVHSPETGHPRAARCLVHRVNVHVVV